MKKVKGIELFKMIADGKVNQHTRVSVDNYNDCSLDFVFEDGRNIFKWLDEDFEILENDTEKIKEIGTNSLFTIKYSDEFTEKAQNWNFRILKNKINELVRAVNSLGGKNE